MIEVLLSPAVWILYECSTSRSYSKQDFGNTVRDRKQKVECLMHGSLSFQFQRPKKHLWMSTGWTTMMFALEVCDDIHVYGMTYEEYCRYVGQGLVFDSICGTQMLLNQRELYGTTVMY